MKPITLSIKRDGFRGDQPDPVKGLADFKTIRPVVLERDRNVCQFCGFHAPKYQEVHHLEDHEDNSPENLITACSICHMCHHIGFAGIKSKGVLIYCKEGANIPNFQAVLNNLVRTLWFCELSENKEISLNAKDYLKRLENLRVAANSYLGTSDPIFLANYLRELDDKTYNSRGTVLEGIYLLPLKEGYKNQFSYWNNLIKKKGSIESSSNIAQSKAFTWLEVLGENGNMAGLKSFLKGKGSLY